MENADYATALAEVPLDGKDAIENTKAAFAGKVAEYGCAQSVAVKTKEDDCRVFSTTTESGSAVTNIEVTLENESVWSRFHNVSTEMILTKQGKRMFPCCRFRLSGLDPNRKYFLIMDIMALDDFRHKWNGKTWEPNGIGERHAQGQVCFHPESPALGRRWMEGPVSFYKMRLTHNSLDKDGCIVLHPMHRYQPRLYVVPVRMDTETDIPLEGPDVHMFTFPKTEFYAVTSYQNPQITQLKMDSNPFRLAFREDRQSNRLIQNKFKVHLPDRPQSQLPVQSCAMHTNNEENKISKNVSSCTKDLGSKHTHPESGFHNEEEEILSKRKRIAFDETRKVTYNCDKNEMSEQFVRDKTVQAKAFSGSPLLSERSKHVSEVSMRSQISRLHGVSAMTLPHGPKAISSHTKNIFFRSRRLKKPRKAKSKWWTNVKHAKAPVIINPVDVSMQPDLEDVEGMLFVSFAAKEAHDTHVQNMMKPAEPSSQSQNQTQRFELVKDVSLTMEERISKHEHTLLQHLKEIKNRQVIHPVLQQVGMKLNLLDPALPIDLLYLGVSLPLPVQATENSLQSESSSNASFVSQTGKTSDPTKIKGWRDKLNSKNVKSTTESSGNHSAFFSDMLDEYLENEAQQISDRAAVFLTSSPSPVAYQLPSKSSSYVRTLNSVLQSQSLPANPAPTEFLNMLQPQSSQSEMSPVNIVPPPLARSQTSTPSFQEHRFTESGTTNFSNVYSKHGVKRRRGRPRLNPPCPRIRGSGRDGWRSVTTDKKVHKVLLLQEVDTVLYGKNRTCVSMQRAEFALSSLVTLKKSVKEARFTALRLNEDVCMKDFCRLGCICDSLNRKIRGPTHCRRVQCMFGCSCFKHKVLLVHPQQTSQMQNGKMKSLMAFPIPDPVSDCRPEPGPSITTLWKRNPCEHDPEPLFIPKAIQLHASIPRPNPEEVEKDPVYLYIESMMTCARVREYNSNPPPQVHVFPVRKNVQVPKKETNKVSQLHPSKGHLAAQGSDETSAVSRMTAGEPESTKVLEILSECNWEAHRNLMLKELYRRVNMNLLSPPFFVDIYKVKLLSTVLKKYEASSTVVYTVCVSLSEKSRKTDGPSIVNKTERNINNKRTLLKNTTCQKVNKPDATDEQQPKRNTLPCHVVLPGYLRAHKKTSEVPGLIKVNGKSYTQAKLLLGHMGALHPANRLAAYVTGRLKPVCQNQTKQVSEALPRSVSNMPIRNVAAFKTSNTQPSKRQNSKAPGGTKHTPSPHTPENNVPNPAKPVTVIPASCLPPGQTVVLQPVPGMQGANVCQFNGQTIQLVPVSSASPIQPKASSFSKESTQQEPQTSPSMQLPQMTTSTLVPLNPTPSQTAFSTPLPIIAPTVLTVLGKTGINFVSGTAAHGAQTGFPGKTGTFSFRICPPTGEGKSTGPEQTGKPPESGGAASILFLPGGYKLIKLPMFVNPSETLRNTASTPSDSVPPGTHMINECTGKSDNSPDSKILNDSEIAASQSVAESASNDSMQTDAVCISDLGRIVVQDSDGTDESDTEQSSTHRVREAESESENTAVTGTSDWILRGVEMTLRKRSKRDSMDDRPPRRAERVLWEEEESLNKDEDDNLEKNLNADTDGSDNVLHLDDPVQPETIATAGANGNSVPSLGNQSLLDKKASQSTEPEQQTVRSSSAIDCPKENHCEAPQNTPARSSCVEVNHESPTTHTSSVPIKSESSEHPTWPPLSTALNTSDHDLVPKDGSPGVIKTEPNNDSIQSDIFSKHHDIYDGGLPCIRTFAPVNKIKSVNNPLNTDRLFCKQPDNNEQCTDSEKSLVRIKIEPHSDTEETDQLSNYPEINYNAQIPKIPNSSILLKNNIKTESLSYNCSNTDEQVLAPENDSSILKIEITDNDPISFAGIEHPITNKVSLASERDPSVYSLMDSDKASSDSRDSDSEIDIESSFSCSLLESQTSTVSALQNKFAHKFSAHANNCDWLLRKANQREESDYDVPEEYQIRWRFKRKRQEVNSGKSKEGGDPSHNSDCSDGEWGLSNDDSSPNSLSCSDGWTTEDVKHKLGRSSRMACNPVNISNLPLYKRAWHLNHAARERKRRIELQRCFDSLKRTLKVDHVKMSIQDILIEAHHMIGALEDRSRSLMEKKKALIQRQSLYITAISQLSAEGTTLKYVKEKTAGPSLTRPQAQSAAAKQPVAKRPLTLPNIVLQSFT